MSNESFWFPCSCVGIHTYLHIKSQYAFPPRTVGTRKTEELSL